MEVKIGNLELDFVASAPGRVNTFSKELKADKNWPMVLNLFIDRTKEIYGKNSKYSWLYNAYAEKGMGKELKHLNNLGANETFYTDSGGLQIISRGAKIDDKTKDAVYKEQLENKSYAMIFDEIPLKTPESGSSIGSNKDRFLLDSMVHEMGLKTGDNVNRQCEMFQESDSESRPMIIAQGQTSEDYGKYIGAIMENLDAKYYDRIQGLSLSGACRGSNLFLNIDIFNTVKQLEVPNEFKRHIHLLGAGAINKIAPIIIMYKSGFMNEPLKLSFDSTSQTSSYDFGLYQYYDGTKPNTQIGLGKVRNATVDKVFNNRIYEPYKDLWAKLDIKTLDELYDYGTIYTTIKHLQENKKPGDYRKYCDKSKYAFHLVKFLYIYTQICDFNKCLEDIISGDLPITKITNNQKYNQALQLLLDVKTNEDYKEWSTIVKRFLLNPERNTIQKYKDEDEMYLKEQLFNDIF